MAPAGHMTSKIDDHSTLSTSRVADSRERGTPARVSLAFYHRDGTELFELRGPGSFVVGRSFPSDVVIPDPSLSRLHARFSWVDGELTLTDLESKNGAFVAGQRITERRVEPGDDITLGRVVVTVHVMTPPQALQQGIESYERFRARLRDELVRARTFDRPLSLAMVRAIGAEPAQVGQFAPSLMPEARAVDRFGMYDGRTCLLLMLELPQAEAEALLRRLLAAADGGVALSAGLATFPEAASSDEELIARARQACAQATSPGSVQTVRVSRESDPGHAAAPIVRDSAMQALYRTLAQVGGRGMPVLLVGETGVGKEVLAAALHAASRRKGPLRVINCATIPAQLTESILFGYEKGAFTGALKRSAGLFEDANEGTVFLDEIGELSLSAQAALLRVLQEKRVMRVGSTQEVPVDAHVVAATHRNLEDMLMRGQFRKDLLYRLNTITLEIPPLRERRSEIRPLAAAFLSNAAGTWGGSASRFSEAALQCLEEHDWPGNVRELRNVVDRAVALCDRAVIEPIDLPVMLRAPRAATPAPASPQTLTAGPPPDLLQDDAEAVGLFRDRVRDFELKLIRDALEQADGNLTRAAELLRIPIRTLTYKLKAYGLRSESE